MHRLSAFHVSVALTFIALTTSAFAQTPPNSDWKYDLLRTKKGVNFYGLLEEETKTEIKFAVIKRTPGRPTVVFRTAFNRSEVDKLVKLDPKDREELLTRVKALDPSGQVEDQRMKGLELKPAFWGDERKEGLSYASDHFLLISNASEDIVRRVAVRLEQIYAAYTHFLPPVNRPAKPNTTTTILLIQSIPEYQALLKSQGRDIINPAFYDALRNEVVCASELQPLGKRLAAVRREHEAELEIIKRQEADAKKLPKGEVQARALKQIQEARQEIAQANSANEELFRKATQQLFQTLYHESFHAYLANFVYPSSKGDVPRWLNEGLAQIFETALVEAGELRVGHVAPARLEKLQEALKNKELVPLVELLKSGPQQYVVAHGQDRRAADRYYLTAWALAQYLTFDRHLLGSKALDKYVASQTREADPLATFQELAGQPLPEFEKEWHEYIGKLQSDGTAARGK